MTHVRDSPNNKAAGPSGISYEMIKHLGPISQQFLWKFVSACITTTFIPDEWRDAFVYPIPKPKEWEYELTNTQPITLLETVRKLMVKISNQRLSTLFAQRHIFKGYQFAGIPGSSTMEPIRILNELIEDAKEKKSELWIVFQDMSKCYDRVNIYMLEKAMLRLKLPQNFIEIIKNRVFTVHGLTDPYDVLIGIDQREVISPLLWCIYYDPLLVEVQSRQLGYNLSHTYRQNLYDPSSTTTESINIPALAYMDDTNWISGSEQNMASILTIAKEFFSFTNILVNDFKAELMTTAKLTMITNSNGVSSPAPITFSTGSSTVTLTPALHRSSVRYLGVWINLNKSRAFVLNQCK